MLCESLPCALSGSSLSSDIATQVTCIVFEQCPSKFSSFGCCHLFLLFGGLVFPFPPTRSLSSPSLYDTSVSMDKCPRTSVLQVFKFNPFVELFLQVIQVKVHVCFTTCFCQAHRLKARLWGWVSPQIPHFQKEKRVRLPARVHSSWSVAHKSHGS